MEDDTDSTDPRADRWRSRPWLSRLVSGAVFVTPIAVSIATATVTAHLLPRPHGVGPTAAWWIVVLAVPTIVLIATDQIARKALPLAVLLKMTMVFPDHAPKRLAVARRAGSTRALARRVEEARDQGIADEPVLAAEKILALAGALNAHDRLTRGHGERVRAYTDMIADELELSEFDRDRLRWSALLHDVGKLAVHPHVLNKAESLNDDEWEEIKRHPLEGARLTAPLAPWLGEWANTIAEHHEKYDGTGYPHGLAGEDISLGGRIVAVADCYDTMTSARSYRHPVSPESARRELAACAGSHFDPRVVRAFLDVSIGRLRPVAGPLASLGSLPFVSSVPRLGQSIMTIAQAGLAAITVSGAVSVGVLSSASGLSHHSDVAASVVHGGSQHGPGGAGVDGSGAGGESGSASQPGTGPDGLSGGGAAPGTPGAGNLGAAAGPGSPGTTRPRPSGSAGGSPGTGDSPGGGTTLGTPSSTTPGGAPVTTTTNPGGVPTTTTTAPPASAGSLTIRNGGAQGGRAQSGDQIIVTFSAALSPASFCSVWSNSAFPDFYDPNVVVHGTHASGDDKVTLTDTADCAGGFHFGTIDLGQAGYFNASTATFGGSGLLCSGLLNLTGCSRIHWDGSNTLTITLGQESSGQPTKAIKSVAIFTPDVLLGLSGTARSLLAVQF